MRPTFALVLALSILAAADRAPAETWREITPVSGPSPPARALASAILDSQGRRMVVFGGQGASGLLNDVWAFDLAAHTWTDLTPASGAAPDPRFTPVSVYDPVGHRMITWSGQKSGGAFLNDVWAFDLAAGAWTQLTPSGGPPNIRYGAAGVFDPVAGDLVTFAGFTNLGRFDDVWRLNPAASTWIETQAVNRPLERCLLSAGYDSQGHRMIIYGGQNAGALGDLWAYDLNLDAWIELTPAVSPAGRWFTSHIYDAANHRTVIFGGNTGSARQNEAWAFDLAAGEWKLLAPQGTPPSPREGAMAVYDGVADRMVVFGGRDTALRTDIWELAGLSDATTGTGSGSGTLAVTLHGSHPNPFRGSTRIRFELPVPDRVTLTVHDVRGRAVRTLLDESRPAGSQVVIWDGLDSRGVPASAGIYLCRLAAGGGSASHRMVLLD